MYFALPLCMNNNNNNKKTTTTIIIIIYIFRDDAKWQSKVHYLLEKFIWIYNYHLYHDDDDVFFQSKTPMGLKIALQFASLHDLLIYNNKLN